ncbi:hypothetical protein O181_076956 [Austropuccinia psidii MF-1]|uniref:Secreted protein n=1 Tax=Austropuccinia psidii MF-1 TaxID=1389203 RepID=A0A9Q3FBE8_9BASI|nr:hypothetical protein [Austropuccinia psidii MF-1]
MMTMIKFISISSIYLIHCFSISVAKYNSFSNPTVPNLKTRALFSGLTFEINAKIMPAICSGIFACSTIDPSWPSQSFNCSQSQSQSMVSDYSVMTARDSAIMYGVGNELNKSDWPQACGTPPSGAKMMSYTNGDWTVLYSVTARCTCPQGVQPQCGGAKEYSTQACNIATFKFCQMRQGSKIF